MSRLAAHKQTIPKIQKMKVLSQKITSITCYDYTFARLVEECGFDFVLVGDSLGMVIQGEKNTLPVTIDQMAYHSACVARGLTRSLLVTDMPFMSYQSSQGEALDNAGRIMKEGLAESIKMEGGVEIADLVYRMNRVGIPVMGHIGLQPQSVHRYGGYKIQGKSSREEKRLLEDARALEEAGSWALVLEGIPAEVAAKVTQKVKIPTIGIGSGPDCDGQILVLYDLLGMNPDFNPRFLKKYTNLSQTIPEALMQYAKEVREGKFPAGEHSFYREIQYAASQVRTRDTKAL